MPSIIKKKRLGGRLSKSNKSQKRGLEFCILGDPALAEALPV